MMRFGLIRCFQASTRTCRVAPILHHDSWRWFSSTKEGDLVVSILGPPNAGASCCCNVTNACFLLIFSPFLRICTQESPHCLIVSCVKNPTDPIDCGVKRGTEKASQRYVACSWKQSLALVLTHQSSSSYFFILGPHW